MEIKTCNACGLPRPLTEYHKASRNVDGLYHTCKECRKEIDRIRYQTNPSKKAKNGEHRKRLSKWLSDYKRSVGCKLCNEREPVALDFHHTDGKKEAILSRLKSSRRRIEMELPKCEVVCANCHRKVHAGLLQL